jgi:protein-disulfide isomerase
LKKNTFAILLSIQVITLILVIILLFQNLSKKNSSANCGNPIENQIDGQPTSVSKKAERNYIFGDSLAPNFLIVFSRYNCDYCKHFNKVVMDSLKHAYVSSGKLKVIYNDLVSTTDKTGMLMAKVAEVGRQTGHFPEIHDLFFSLNNEPDSVEIIKLAIQSGITINELQAGLNSPRTLSNITEDNMMAKNLNFNGTPSFVLNDLVHPGYITFKEIENKIGTSAIKAEKCEQSK